MQRMLNLSGMIEKTRSFCSCSILLGVFLASALSAAAQTTPSPGLQPDRGTRTPGGYSISDLENVSLTNGNLNLTIPLASLPPSAGGKLSWTINAIYNSKLWDVKSEQYPADINHLNQPYYLKHIQASSQGGWELGGRYEIYQQSIDDEIQIDGCVGQPDCTYATFRYKYFLNTPDGVRHELRPLDAPTCNGCPPWRSGYFAQTPDTLGSAMRYYSYDGSYLWAVINPSGSATAWTVYLKDGTRVTMSGGIERIYDTNGNSIAIYTTVDGSGNSTTHYVDERTNREIKLYRAFGSSNTQVQYQKVGGAWETITINWGTTDVYGLVYNVDDRSCQPLAREHSDTLSVIRSIVLPQTEPGLPGRSFSFNYNSDTAATAVPFQYRPAPACNPTPVTVTAASRGWGQVSRMTMPTGAYVDYTWDWDNVPNKSAPLTATEQIAGETIKQKKVTYDGGQFSTWAYVIGSTSGTVTAPDNSVTTETFYSHSTAKSSSLAGISGFGGMVYRSDRAGKIRIERKWGLKIFDGAYSLSPEGIVNFNNVLLAEYTTLMEGGSAVKMAAKTFQYDFNGNVTQTTEYDWFDPALVSRDSDGVPTAVPGSATVLRTTTNTYYNPADASSSTNVYAKRVLATAQPLILSAPRDSITGPSQTRFSFEGQAWGTTPTIGNLTRLSKWDDQSSTWLDTVNTYDIYGNRLTTTAPKGVASTGVPNDFVMTYVWDPATHANVTSVTVDPLNGSGVQTTTSVYDYSTGLLTSQTDPNGKISTISYVNQLLGAADPFLRPGLASGPAVTSVANGVTYTNQQAQARNLYYDTARQVVVERDLNTQGDRKLKTRVTSDLLGRPTLTESNEDGTSNWTISTQNVYVEMGRITLSSNPRRSAAAQTDGWTRITKDNLALGRVTEMATFATTTQPPNTGTTANWTGSVTTTYYSNQVTVRDQANKQRRSFTDGAGRLTQVDEMYEHPSTSVYATTTYVYDTFNNLRSVTQGSQQRFFKYDSLSRLIRTRNPETRTASALATTGDPLNNQWSMAYAYDLNGNLTERRSVTGADASPSVLTTTYGYDGLNRNTSVAFSSYATGTSGIERVYDLATNGKGLPYYTVSYNYRWDGDNKPYWHADATNSYDAVGRPLNRWQGFILSNAQNQATTWQQYNMTRAYNLAGAVSSQTYPSGRSVSYSYDNAGRLSGFTGNIGDGAPRTYATSISYHAAGQLYREQFNTGTAALYHKMHYNSRQQMVSTRLSTINDDLNWNRGAIINFYGTNSVTNWDMYAKDTDSNSNLRRQAYYVPDAVDGSGNVTAYSIPTLHDFTYDALNRLGSTYESQMNASGVWSFGTLQQTYNYDQWGNRTVSGQTIDTTTNRMTASGGVSLGYDATGNQTSNGAYSRWYEAENRMTKATASGGTSYYYYNAEGQRTRRVVGTAETWLVYGFEGELVAEYPVVGTFNGSNPPTVTQKEYGHRSGQLLVVGGCDTMRWLVGDQVGTPRMESDTTGSLAGIRRHDYLPFGEDLFGVVSGTNQRTTGRGYTTAAGQDCVRQQFTSKERDTESGLDFFEARYYSSLQGRFTSADPIIITPERVIDPQQLNLFAYARNNPLRFTDPTGEDIVENVADEYKERYKKWKDEFLSTEAGRKQWNKYANDKNFTLTITVSKDRGEGALADGYKWDANGKLNAATITLGSKLDSGYPSPDHYPVTSSLRQGDPQYNTAVSGEVLAATKIAHEFGHVNRTANVDATLYQLQNKLISEWNDVFFKSGASDPRLAQLEQQMGGTPVTINKDREHWAEANTIPFLNNRFPGGKGDSMPGRIKKAIESYQKTYPGR